MNGGKPSPFLGTVDIGHASQYKARRLFEVQVQGLSEHLLGQCQQRYDCSSYFHLGPIWGSEGIW